MGYREDEQKVLDEKQAQINAVAERLAVGLRARGYVVEVKARGVCNTYVNVSLAEPVPQGTFNDPCASAICLNLARTGYSHSRRRDGDIVMSCSPHWLAKLPHRRFTKFTDANIEAIQLHCIQDILTQKDRRQRERKDIENATANARAVAQLLAGFMARGLTIPKGLHFRHSEHSPGVFFLNIERQEHELLAGPWSADQCVALVLGLESLVTGVKKIS